LQAVHFTEDHASFAGLDVTAVFWILCKEGYLNINPFIIAAGNVWDCFFAEVVDTLIFINEILDEEAYGKTVDKHMLFYVQSEIYHG
jgi:hypothetical protein